MRARALAEVGRFTTACRKPTTPLAAGEVKRGQSNFCGTAAALLGPDLQLEPGAVGLDPERALRFERLHLFRLGDPYRILTPGSASSAGGGEEAELQPTFDDLALSSFAEMPG
jgi:hypothetical protein